MCSRDGALNLQLLCRAAFFVFPAAREQLAHAAVLSEFASSFSPDMIACLFYELYALLLAGDHSCIASNLHPG